MGGSGLMVPMNSMVGKVLQNGKYVLHALLKSGELEITYQASHGHLNQPVVITALNPNLRPQVDFAHLQPQFIAEARRIAQCQHPNLAKVLDYFQEEETVFVVLEAIAGQSLLDLVQQSGPLSENQAIYYIRQASLALNVLHQQGILHRQIGPQNLVRRQNSESIMLTNFGLAREGLRMTPAYTHTLPSGYTASEQYQPQAKLTIATDLYALAATLYFLTTGQSPVAASLRSRISLPSLRQLQPQLSPTLEQAVLRTLSPEISERPATVEAWLSLLITSPVPPDTPNQQGHNQQGYYPTLSTPTPTQVTLPRIASEAPSEVTGVTLPALALQTPVASTNDARLAHLTARDTPATIRLPQQRLGKVLLITGAIAALVGAGIGFAIRFGLSGSSKSSLFHTEQSFPPRSDWPAAPSPATTTPAESTTPRSYVAPSAAPVPYRPPTPPIQQTPSNPASPPTTPIPAVNPVQASPPTASPSPSPPVPAPEPAPALPTDPTPGTGAQPPASTPAPTPTTPEPPISPSPP